MLIEATRLVVNEPQNTITYSDGVTAANFSIETKNAPISLHTIDGSIMFGAELYYTGIRLLSVRNPSGFQFNTYFFKFPSIPSARDDFAFISGLDMSIEDEPSIFDDSNYISFITEGVDSTIGTTSTTTVTSGDFDIRQYFNEIFISEKMVSVPNNSESMY